MSFPLEEHSHTFIHLVLPHPVFLVSSKVFVLVLMAMLFILQVRSNRKSLQIYTEIKCVKITFYSGVERDGRKAERYFCLFCDSEFLTDIFTLQNNCPLCQYQR